MLSREVSKSNDVNFTWRGSSGVQTLAVIVLFGPGEVFFSLHHESECPARGCSPPISDGDGEPRTK